MQYQVTSTTSEGDKVKWPLQGINLAIEKVKPIQYGTYQAGLIERNPHDNSANGSTPAIMEISKI